MEKKFTKLSALVGSSFTINESQGVSWKKWNAEEKKMEVSQTLEKGFRKVYTFDTNEGTLDLGVGQLGSLLVECFDTKQSLVGATFSVKSNGKTGMDIRYYFNISAANQAAPESSDPGPEWA